MMPSRTAALLAASVLPVVASVATPAQDRFHVVQLSDVHVGARAGKPHLELVLGKIAALEPRPSLVVVTGDLTEKGLDRELDDYVDCVDGWTARTGIPVLSAPGNHDSRWFPTGPSRLAGHAGGRWPRIRVVGDVGFVALDSTLSFGQHGHFSPRQIEDARAAMASLDGVRDWVLAFHHPVGIGRFLDDRSGILSLCEQFPVRLILTGHGHRHKLWKIGQIQVAMAIGVMNGVFGYRVLEVSPERFELSAVRIPDDAPAQPGQDEAVIDRTVPAPRVAMQQAREVVEGMLARGETRDDVVFVDALEAPNFSGTDPSALLERVPGRHELLATTTTGAGVATIAVHVEDWPRAGHPDDPFAEREASRVVFTRRQEGTFLNEVVAGPGGRIHAATEEGTLLRLGPRLGAELDVDVPGPVHAVPWTSRVGSEDSAATYVDGRGGTWSLWQTAERGPPSRSPRGPIVRGQVEGLVLGVDGLLHAPWQPDRAVRLPTAFRSRWARVAGEIRLACWDRNVYRLDAETLEVLGSTTVTNSFYYSAATADAVVLPDRKDGRHVLFGHDHRILVFEPGKDEPVLAGKAEGLSPSYSGGRARSADQLVVGSLDGAVGVVDVSKLRQDGTFGVVRKVAVEGAVFDSTPLLLDGGTRCAVGTMTGRLCFVDLERGVLERSWSLGGYVVADPVLVCDRVVVGSATGMLVSVPAAAPAPGPGTGGGN